MKSETSVQVPEFRLLYDEESNVKQAAIWSAEEQGSITFQDQQVYMLSTDPDTRYFVLLRSPTRVGYCMLMKQSDILGLRMPYEVAIWVDWSSVGNTYLTNHLLAMILKDHDVVFDGNMSKYGCRIIRDRMQNLLWQGYQIGKVTEKGVAFYRNLEEIMYDNHIAWGYKPSNPTKIIIRKPNHE